MFLQAQGLQGRLMGSGIHSDAKKTFRYVGEMPPGWLPSSTLASYEQLFDTFEGFVKFVEKQIAETR
jgi:hypothetical protein